MRVQVYKNLRRGDWSVRCGGKVIAHLAEVILHDVSFVVRETRRQAVIAKHCREVHAWCEGEIDGRVIAEGDRVAITYNPYRSGSFTRRDDGVAVSWCEHVHFTAADGAVAIGGVR